MAWRRIVEWRAQRRFKRKFGRLSFAQEGEDMVLRKIFENLGRPGRYVDVGAHHPVRFSNTYFFYLRGWRGINVEPNPDIRDAFLLLRPNDINLTLGVAPTAGILEYTVFNEPALNTFDSAFAARMEAEKKYSIVNRIRIPVQRLDQVLSEHHPANTPIDFMSVDVEGLDLEVLRSNDWTRFRPQVVVVEQHDFDISRPELFPMHVFMREQGYALYSKCMHSLIYKQMDKPA